MNQKEKKQFFRDLQDYTKNPRISDVWYDKRLLERGHDDSIWYDGPVLALIIDHRFSYVCSAMGSVDIVDISTDNDESESRTSYIRSFLYGHGYTTDKKVLEAERKGKIIFNENNWFTEELIDTNDQSPINHNIMEGADCADSPFDFDLSYIDEYIQEYKEKKGEK